MDYSRVGESPAMLQLHRWSSSHFQLNPSEFREAFISPTRELLLLLSYQCEALLLPLTTGEFSHQNRLSHHCGNSLNSDHPESCNYENLQDPHSPALSASVPSRSDPRENMPCTSGSVAVSSDNDFLCENKISKCSGYPSVCDVNSLAWGLCGDDYDQHKDTFFRELLFVSGNRGVTVHAFCHCEKITEMTKSTLEGEFAQGMWVEWGPSSTSVHHGEVQRDDTLCSDAPGILLDVNKSSGTKVSCNFCGKDGDDESARSLAPKKWLRSFFTKAETVKSEGNIWTRFPEKLSYPCSAKVVSFSIFDSSSSLFSLLSQMHCVSNGSKSYEEAALNSVNNVSIRSHTSLSNLENDTLSSSLSVGLNSSYECSKVFSNNSHNLIGFVLMVADSVPENMGDTSESRLKKFLLAIARLDGWGMQWISLVKLDEGLNMCSQVGWMDFQFSDNLLVCLNASGLIFFYNAITGKYVAHIDVLHACGFGPQPSLQELEKVVVEGDLGLRNADLKIKQVDGVNEKSTYQVSNFGKRMFRRLVVASHTSLLAVVDEYGVIYVIYAGACVPDKYYCFEKLVPQFQHLGLGMLAGWEIGDSEIGHQHVFSNGHNPNTTTVMAEAFSVRDDIGSNELQEVQCRNIQCKGAEYDLHLSGFSSVSKMIDKRFPSSKLRSQPMRKILLPTNKFSEDDLFCFSPLGITRLIKKQNSYDKRSFQILHSCLHVDSSITDDGCLNSRCQNLNFQWREDASEAIGCTFEGCFYLVTQGGLSVVLPSISVSPNFFPIEALGYRQPSISTGIRYQGEKFVEMEESKQPWPPWKVEVLDRVLLYEGPDEADCLCLENGWDLKMSRMRRLQLGLDYLKFDEIEQSLEMLVSVCVAEEGILRLIFAAVYLMFCKVANDNEISAASRLLALGTCFATKMIRKYGLVQHKTDACELLDASETQMYSIPVGLPNKEQIETENSRKLHEMAHFLEIIRNLQCQLSAKFKVPGQVEVGDGEALSAMDADLSQDDAQLSILSADALSLDTLKQHELSFPLPELGFNDTEKLALMPMESLDSKNYLDSRNLSELSALVSQVGVLEKAVLPIENPKDMIARWEIDNLDLKTVVKDALLSGRLPLAVLQLHLHRSRDLVNDKEPHDTFAEVRDIGRAIAYDLFLKGETRLAVATLQKLGEDIETSLKELVFGMIRRPLRLQIAEEMKRYGYLGPYELKILERISLIERLYPSSSFWRTVLGRRKEFMRGSSNSDSPGENNLRILPSHIFNNLIIECGEIDGVVLGSWETVNESTAVPVLDEDDAHIGYWATAAVWSNAWDQTTIDRIVLDQHFLMGVQVLWESQLEYYICRNDWAEVSKLLDMIPSSLLSYGSLQMSLDSLQSASTVGCNQDFHDYGNYICSIEELDTVCIDIPYIKIFRCTANNMCTIWLRMFMEQKLAEKFIFLKDYWEGTAEIVPLLARSNFITSRTKIPLQDKSIESSSDLNISDMDGPLHADTVQALHKLVIHHCVQYNLPNLLDVYLDHHKLTLDNGSLSSLQEAAGDCHWAKWLLLSRIKGREYDASFMNARSIMLRNAVPSNNLNVLEIEEIIRIVDDIAEGGGEIAALATLMFAPVPIQNCLSSGSVNRHYSSSAQCTLENLRPTLQRFPTLWRTLVAASFGHDATSNFLSPKAKNVFGNSSLSDYLNWRDNIFFSTGHDTSLLQMLPCWFSKAIRRLIQLYVQGPLGWQTLESFVTRDMDPFVNSSDHADMSAISWEAAIQKHVEEELYASSLKESGLGLEQYLHRGRALAALNHLLGVRVQKLKLEKTKGQSSASVNGQTNVQSDVQMLLASITQSEESLLSSVTPLAILHFEDSVLVASCALLLELCGLSASMLRIDIAALRRISSFYKSSEYTEHYRQFSPKGSALHAVSHEVDITNSLARALADHYMCHDGSSIVKQKGTPNSVSGEHPSRALMLVLQHLEKVSLPLMADGRTCGSWLFSGNCDGAELRSHQKAASQHWNLVTIFCQMHQIPLSTKYLGFLARDNDWVGFLSEAQVGGYPFETVIQVASREFSDPRLKIHVVTVLKGLLSRKKISSSSNSDTSEKRNETSFADENSFIPVELFDILAECEKRKNPGEALLVKAKELCWSILAMVASCFPDVSPLSCLTVWLEITAARETSSIKVNDIASKIANSVGAAVEATNSLPAGGRPLQFHYNRRNPKRRRLMETISLEPLDATISDVSCVSDSSKIFSVEGFVAEEERKSDASELTKVSVDSDDGPNSLSKMVAVLSEQHLFLPLLRAFEMFLPSCSLLPFIRALQAFSQMRLSEASAHLGSFSARIKEEPVIGREGQIGTSWISSTAVKSADAMLSTCPSPYEKRCLLQLLAATDFGDGGSAATYYRRLYWKINLAEPSLRKDDGLHLGNETLDDSSLLTALEKNGHWEQARNWARQLEASGGPWKSAVHHVTETQAESMVAEWKEFLWDVPEERVALWNHCQTLFLRYSFPALQAGLFFLKHAEAVEKDLPTRELHELLLLSLQWLSGLITLSNPVYPLHLLREIETRVWLLAVESEAQVKSEGGDLTFTSSSRDPVIGRSSNIVDRTASMIAKMDNHINTMRSRSVEKNDTKENNNQAYYKNSLVFDSNLATAAGGNTKTKRRAKGYVLQRRPVMDTLDKSIDPEDGSSLLDSRNDLQLQDENFKLEVSFSRWAERVGPGELERAVLSLLEFGQITAARQLQHKLSPGHVPSEFILVDAALKLASLSTPSCKVPISMLDEDLRSVIQSYRIMPDHHMVNPLQVLESLATIFTEGCGHGLCKRIIAVAKAANVLGLSFLEAFNKQPIEVLQLLSLKAQDSLVEANLLVQTHSMPAGSIAQILAESFLKGLLAAHRGGYMDSQKEEGPSPLLWRFSDFLEWAELCPSEPEIGHALMRIVITGQEIPHACEVELLILSHHFYKSSACLDGVDVLVSLAATRVEAYVSEGDFACLARLITGVGNFHALNFILGILIENGQLDLLLQKYSAAADTNTGTGEADRGFQMAVLTALKHFNPSDLDAFAMVYNHFNMKHETAAILESRAEQSFKQWFLRNDKDQNEDLLESMRYYIEAAEVHSSIDAGNTTRRACAQASLVSLQIRMPDFQWLNLSETNARRALVEQSRFQEALIVAEGYNLNWPSEWALVLWNQMLKPELTEQFVAEFVAVLPLHPSMLADLAKFYRAEVAARGDQSQFSVWLTGGGLPAEWLKYLGRSFRCLLRMTRDLRLRLQLAIVATGFGDVIDACNKELDKVPDTAGPLVLRKGHGGAYLPLM